MSTNASRWILALSCALAVAGFLLPLWPLALLGVALAALFGQWIFAVCIGLLLDIAYGTPVGAAHALYFPFTIFALVCAFLKHIGSTYIRRSTQQRL